MTQYRINGSNASLVPYRQVWQDYIMGRDHNQIPIYSSFKSVVLDFDSCDYARYQQWSQLVNGTSLISVWILAQDQASYVSFSGVTLEFNGNKPNQEAGIVGPWSLILHGLQP